MIHTTRVQKYEAHSNGQVTFTLRVDNDPKSDYPVTLAVADAANETTRNTKLAAAKVIAEKMYDDSLAADSAALGLAGQAI